MIDKVVGKIPRNVSFFASNSEKLKVPERRKLHYLNFGAKNLEIQYDVLNIEWMMLVHQKTEKLNQYVLEKERGKKVEQQRKNVTI